MSGEFQAHGAEQVQDPVTDEDAEAELLVDAFEDELRFGEEQDEAELARPGKGKGKEARSRQDDDDDGEEAGDDEGADDADDDDQDEPDEAEARGGKKAKANADEGADPDGDFVELEDGTKLAVGDLLEAHKFRTEVSQNVQQIRERVYQHAQQELEPIKQQVIDAAKAAQETMQLIKTLVPDMQPPPLSMLDPRSDDYDPETYNQLNAMHQQYKAAMGDAEGKLKALKEQADRETLARHQRYLDDNAAKLIAKFPEFAKPETAKTKAAAMRDFLGKTYGFSPEEANAIIDHRYFSVIFDAMELAELKAKGKPKPKENATVKPRLVRGGVRRTPDKGKRSTGANRGALERLARTGKVREADLEDTWGDLID